MNVSGTVSAELIGRRLRHFDRRTRLPLKSDCLWHIESGAVRTLTLREDGTYVTLGLWGAGDVVSPALSTADPFHIECLTPGEASLLSLNDRDLVNVALIRQIQQLQEFIEILHARPVDIALLRLLSWLAKKFGRPVEGGQAIGLRLTHQEIAEILGITRVTVTRLLKEFEEQGAIARLPRQYIVLHDRDPFWYYEI